MRFILGIIAALALSGGAAEMPARAEGGVETTKSAEPEKTPRTTIAFAESVIFAIALGGDPATNAKISVALASELKPVSASAAGSRGNYKVALAPFGSWHTSPAISIVPEASWGLNDYVEQCRQHPDTTKGAFIVLPPSSEVRNDNYLLLVRQSSTVAFNAMIADCQTRAGSADGVARIVWVSDTATGRYGHSTIQFLPVAVLTSVYLAFAPQRTYQTTSTTVFPTPNPLPPSGARSSVQTVSASVINASGTASLQQNIVSAAGGAQLALGRQGNPDHLTMHAAEDAVGKFLLLVADQCKRAGQPAPAPAASTAFCSW